MREFPSFLDRKCTQFVGRELFVKPEDLSCYVGGHEQSLDPAILSVDLVVVPSSFFEQDGHVAGFVGEIRAPGHPLNNFKTVLSTLSDGEDLNFSDKLCRVWKAAFGNSEPSAASSRIPDFENGVVYRGRAVVFEDRLHFVRCQERLNSIDPRKGRSS